MSRAPMYNQIFFEGKPTGLYELVGWAVNKQFVRNRSVSPLRTAKQWSAIDQARAPQSPRRTMSLTAAIDAALTKDVPPPPTLRDIVNYQRAQVGGELLPAPAAPALRTNVRVPAPPSTLEAVVALQRQQGTRPPADVRDITVPSNPHHRQGVCWKCSMPELQCFCPTVAPLVAHTVTTPRQPEPMLCRHCRRAACVCPAPAINTLARVVARQKELRAFTQ